MVYYDQWFADCWFGGADGDRTRDLLVANEAHSQLCYGPSRLRYYSG